MSSGAFLGILMQIIPAFTAATGVEVMVVDRYNGDRYQFTESISQQFCSTYSSSPSCEADMRNIPFDALSGWASKDYTTNVQTYSDVCLYMPPDFGNLSNFLTYNQDIRTKYSIIAGNVNGATEEPASENAAMYNALSTLAECARKDSETIGVQIERELAFASLAMTLIDGDTSFLREPNSNKSRQHANITTSQAAQYGTSIGERILMELWKKETAKSLNAQNYCGNSMQNRNGGVYVSKSSDINTTGISREVGWVPTCPFDEERQSFTQQSLEVNDSNLHLFIFGASEQLIQQARSSDDGGYGPMSPVVSNPPEPYTPFKAFGNYNSALSYIWETSSNLVGG